MKGRPVRGLIGGLLLGIFLDVDLALGGFVKLSSVVLTIVPIALLVVGLLLGLWAPIGRSGTPSMARSGSPPSAPSTVTTSPRTDSVPTDPVPTDPGPPAAEDTPPI